MSDHTEAGRLDKRTAEQLLDGASGHAPLHSLLSAAAAPGRPAELAGEDAAAAAFVAAPARARASRSAMLRRFMTAKVIALIGGTILLTGGVAYATGHFPGRDPAPAPSPTHQRHGDDDSTPATQYSPQPLPSSSTPAPSPSSSAAATEKQQHGKTTAPGQLKNSPNPHSTSAPRGNGSNNGNPPTANPGKAKDNANGTMGNGSPTGQNPRQGTENGSPQRPNPAPTP